MEGPARQIHEALPHWLTRWGSLALVVLYLAWESWGALRGGSHPGPSSLGILVWRSSLEALVTFLLVAGSLWLDQEPPAALGFTSEGLPRQLAIGGGFGLAILAVTGIGLTMFLATLFPDSHTDGLADLPPGPWNLPVLVGVGILGGGVVEEVQRSFILTRFRRVLGARGLLLGLALHTVVFGLGHLYQGWGGAITGGLSGLCLALVWLRRGRILEAIAAHAVMDAVGLALGALLG